MNRRGGVKIRILIFTPRRLYSVGDFARGGIKNTIRIIRSEKFLRDKPKGENRYEERSNNTWNRSPGYNTWEM